MDISVNTLSVVKETEMMLICANYLICNLYRILYKLFIGITKNVFEMLSNVLRNRAISLKKKQRKEN